MTPVPPLGIAYRDWLLSLARAEADRGCPRLFAIKSDIAMYFVDTVEEWTADQRYSLMCACIKRLFEGNYGYPPLPVTAAESNAIGQWDYPYFGHWCTPGKPKVEIVWASTGARGVVDANKVRAALRWDEVAHTRPKLSVKLLKASVRGAMLAKWGKPEVVGPLWKFSRELDDVIVVTHVDFGVRRPDQFEYSQTAWDASGTRKLVKSGGISELLGWPQTRWYYLRESDIPAAADLLVDLCNEFAEAVPRMVRASPEALRAG